MLIRKIRFQTNEVDAIYNQYDGYIWAAVDLNKGMLAAGDEYVRDLRDALIQRKCPSDKIVGVGIDLDNAEVHLYSPINPKANNKIDNHRVPDADMRRLDDLVEYFFGAFPCFMEKEKQKKSHSKPSIFYINHSL